jgi:hypothetical protein
MYLQNKKATNNSAPINNNLQQTSSSTDTSNLQTYTNTQYGFQFEYPKGMTITTLHVSGPTANSSGDDQFYIKELNDARLVGVSKLPSGINNDADLISNLNSTQGSNFTNVENSFFNLGNGIFNYTNGQQNTCGEGGGYEIVIHNGYEYTFLDYKNCADAGQIDEIINTFTFTDSTTVTPAQTETTITILSLNGNFVGNNILNIKDNNGKEWSVNYQNAKLYYTNPQANPSTWSGNISDWLTSSKASLAPGVLEGNEGQITIVGSVDANGVLNASSITQYAQ